MVANRLSCWKCGESLGDIPLPLGRLAKCKSCNADLHTCRMCEFFDTTVSKKCREPIAEEVLDKKHSNFCGYLQPDPGAFSEQDRTGLSKAESELDALFGLNPEITPDNDLSAKDGNSQKLDELFGLGGKKDKY